MFKIVFTLSSSPETKKIEKQFKKNMIPDLARHLKDFLQSENIGINK